MPVLRKKNDLVAIFSQFNDSFQIHWWTVLSLSWRPLTNELFWLFNNKQIKRFEFIQTYFHYRDWYNFAKWHPTIRNSLIFDIDNWNKTLTLEASHLNITLLAWHSNFRSSTLHRLHIQILTSQCDSLLQLSHSWAKIVLYSYIDKTSRWI